MASADSDSQREIVFPLRDRQMRDLTITSHRSGLVREIWRFQGDGQFAPAIMVIIIETSL